MKFSSILIIILLLALPAGVHGQYPFGKNKVIYSRKEWKVLETEHVDIYHYPSERNLAVLCVPIVEDTYAEYSELFGIDFNRRVPFVLFSSHYDFQQTNILPTLIPEYTAGFTDLIKGRIAVPFSGSLADIRHVIRHEMVHAFMLEKLDRVLSEHGKYNYYHPPLWFVEGLAEYVASGEVDTRSRMFIRDALMSQQLLDLDQLWRIEGTFMMYKQGEAVARYIADNFGKAALIKILDNWWMSDRMSVVLKKTINMDLGELNDAFMRSIKRRYYPEILHKSFATEEGLQLTDRGTFHSRPVPLRDEGGKLEVVSLCARHGTINICRLGKEEDGRLEHTILIEGGRTSEFESIPAFRSKMELRGDTLLFVSKSRARDVIYMWDIARNEKLEAYSFDKLSMISSPTLSPEGQRLVFSAIDTTGTMDLYLYDRGAGKLERLTNDSFSEEDPDFNPRGEVILFASDRCRRSEKPQTGIYMLNLPTREIRPMLCSASSDSDPEWLPDGRSFLYTSDRNGVYNIYLYHEGLVARETNVLGGVTDPAALPDGSGFVATGYFEGGYHVFYFPLEKRSGGFQATVDSTLIATSQPAELQTQFRTKDYRMKLGLDLIGTGLAVDPDFGEIGNGAQLLLSDLLGNHQFYVFFGNSSQGFDEFWKRMNAGVTYVNLSRRVNYMIGLFHLTTFWGDFFSPFRMERRYGVAMGASYPFSKFSRTEGSLVVRGIERESDFPGVPGGSAKSVLATTFLSYVADNTLWTIGGPLKGMRYYLTGGHTFDLQGRGFDNTSLHFDLRKYFKLGERTLFATRFLTRNSWGGDFQLFYIGGPWDLRGYDFREFAGRSIYLFNTELRFPLLDRLALSFPFGTVEMPPIRGSIFFDAGRATRFVTETDWLGAMGAGVELNLGYAPVIRVNFTRTTDFDKISDDTHVGLFIGYNY